MKFFKTSFVAIGVALFAGASPAQTEAGKFELSGLFTYAHTWAKADGGGDTMSFDEYVGVIGAGYFINNAWEIKANTAFIGFCGEGVDVSAVAIMVGPDYHFLTDKTMVPYVGVYGGGIFANGSFNGNDESACGPIVDAHVGLKQFVSKNVSIDYRVSYQYAEIRDVTLNNMMAIIGINFQF